MKFAVEVVTKTSGRLGRLSHPESGKSLQTPLLLQTTKAGSIPYLSKEVFGFVNAETQILQICLANCDHMDKALEAYGKDFASFVGYGGCPTFLILKDPCEIAPTGFHEKDIVPLFTRRGKAAITVDRFMNFVEKVKPNIYHALCDSDTNDVSPKKRIVKSVERSEQFFNACTERHKNSEALRNSLFLAPIVGGYCKEAREKCIKNVLKETLVGGYLFDGFHNNGESAASVRIDKVKDILVYCLQQLPKDKLNIMPGAYTPLAILEFIKLGIDIFDTSYVYISTEKFWALTFNFDIEKKEHIPPYIELSNEEYKEAFEPILENCTCLTCKKHTKAYIHHLINTKELLGPILLMIHNTHHYMEFFQTIRKLISEDKLEDLIVLMRMQNFGSSKLKEKTTIEESAVNEKNCLIARHK